MLSTNEFFLKLKVAQLEGKMAIYEGIIKEIEKLESMQVVISKIKDKLESVAAVWEERKLK